MDESSAYQHLDVSTRSKVANQVNAYTELNNDIWSEIYPIGATLPATGSQLNLNTCGGKAKSPTVHTPRVVDGNKVLFGNANKSKEEPKTGATFCFPQSVPGFKIGLPLIISSRVLQEESSNVNSDGDSVRTVTSHHNSYTALDNDIWNEIFPLTPKPICSEIGVSHLTISKSSTEHFHQDQESNLSDHVPITNNETNENVKHEVLLSIKHGFSDGTALQCLPSVNSTQENETNQSHQQLDAATDVTHTISAANDECDRTNDCGITPTHLGYQTPTTNEEHCSTDSTARKQQQNCPESMNTPASVSILSQTHTGICSNRIYLVVAVIMIVSILVVSALVTGIVLSRNDDPRNNRLHTAGKICIWVIHIQLFIYLLVFTFWYIFICVL